MNGMQVGSKVEYIERSGECRLKVAQLRIYRRFPAVISPKPLVRFGLNGMC